MDYLDLLIIIGCATSAMFLVVLWQVFYSDAFGDRAQMKIRELEHKLFLEALKGTISFSQEDYKSTAAFLNAACSVVDLSPITFLLMCFTNVLTPRESGRSDLIERAFSRPWLSKSDVTAIKLAAIDSRKPPFLWELEHQAVQVLVTLMTRRSLQLTIIKGLISLSRWALRKCGSMLAERPSPIFVREPAIKLRITEKAAERGVNPSAFQEFAERIAAFCQVLHSRWPEHAHVQVHSA